MRPFLPRRRFLHLPMIRFWGRGFLRGQQELIILLGLDFMTMWVQTIPRRELLYHSGLCGHPIIVIRATSIVMTSCTIVVTTESATSASIIQRVAISERRGVVLMLFQKTRQP